MNTFILSGLIGWFIGTILNKALPFVFSFIKSLISTDLPKVNGSWIGVYIDKDDEGNSGEIQEHLIVKQAGKKVWGKIYTRDNPNNNFDFKGVICRDSLIANYIGKCSNGPHGAGTFQIKVKNGDSKMSGFASWYGATDDSIHVSKYILKRNP